MPKKRSTATPGADERRELRRLRVAAAGVFVVAVTLRIAHLVALRDAFEGTVLFSVARTDALHHWNEALEILHGNFLLADRVPWKGPGYSYFLALLAAVFGRSPDHLRWPLAVMGAANCGALVLLARRILSVGWAAVAGLLAAVNGVLILFDGELYFPTLLISLSLGVFFLLGRSDAGSGAHAGAGAFSGLAALVHGVYLLPAFLIGLWLARRDRRKALAFGVAVVAVIAPFAFKNLILHGQPVAISWNGGVNLYVANHPTFDQYAGNGTNGWARVMQTPVDAGIVEGAARDRLYYALAARQALRFPVETMTGLAKKAWIFFSPVEYANNIRLYELRDYSPVLAVTLGRWGPLWLPFGLLGPAAILGLLWTLRDRTPLAIVLALWGAGLWISAILFFNTARYRAPVVFIAGLWAAAALSAWSEAWRRGERQRVITYVAVYAALATLLAATAVPQTVLPAPLEVYEVNALARSGSFEKAEPWVERALARDAADPKLRQWASGFYAKWGDREREREQLRALLALPDVEPDLIDKTHERLAASFLLDGRLDDAREELRAALAVGADEAEWRGYPYYQMGLGPLRSCWLRLKMADLEITSGNRAGAREIVSGVRSDCPEEGRIGDALVRLDAILADSRE